MREISQNFKSANIQECKELMSEGVPMIDIRRENEWASSGIIKNAHTIAFFSMFGTYDLDKWLGELHKIIKSKDDKFIITCASANRTKVLANILQDEGYTNIYELDCGMGGWIMSGEEVAGYGK